GTFTTESTAPSACSSSLSGAHVGAVGRRSERAATALRRRFHITSSAALNTAEGAARQSLPDKSRAYAIALAECCEACAAVEIAEALGAVSPEQQAAVLALGVRLKNVLSRLVR